MKICEGNSLIVDVELLPTQSVAEAKTTIGRVMDCDPSCIELIFKGRLLQNEYQLLHYGSFCDRA